MKTWETNIFESFSDGNAVSVYRWRVEAETQAEAREQILAKLEGEQKERWAERGKLEEVEPYTQEELDWHAALRYWDENEELRKEAKRTWRMDNGEWTNDDVRGLRQWLLRRWSLEAK